jgi:ATP-dependent helicase/nuclease subunit B
MSRGTPQHSFLSEVAEVLLREAGEDLGQHTVLLPGKRMSLFLNKELAARSPRPIWAPRYVTLNEWLAERMDIRKAEQSELVFKAYRAYLDVGGTESFEEALRWIHSAVADFAAVDHALADATQLFSNLRNIREIEHWSLRDEPLTKDQQSLVVFWEQLGKVYHAFRALLSEEGVAYPAMMMRMAAEQPEALRAEECRGRIWMVGFNVLSRAEQRVCQQLVREAGLRCMWDADAYYIKDDMQEAGLHLRDELKQFPSEVPPTEGLLAGKKHIRLRPMSGEVAQAKEAALILEQIPAEGAALVMCNESALPAVLNSIPPNVETFNVSAGMRMSNTPLNDLVGAFFALCPKKIPTGDEAPDIYHRHVMRFLESPLIGKLCDPDNTGLIGRFRSYLIRNYRIMVNWADDTANPEFSGLRALDEIMAAALSGQSDGALRGLAHLAETLTESRGLSDVEEEYAFRLGQMARQVLALVEKYPFADSPGVLKTLMMSLLRSETMTFYGEPLTGLQILGLLETRGLDFRHVILTGVNEGTLPGSKMDNSLIPPDLKKAFGLPDYKHREALFAYYFYRLIQRAEIVDILYTDAGGEIGEMSRFVRQITLEATRKNPNITIETLRPRLHVSPSPREVEIPMSDSIRERIVRLLEGGLSPTALAKFINCPLDFYYRYILGMGEPEDMEESPEAATFGTIVHNALEELYTPFVGGKPITREDLDGLLEKAEQAVHAHFVKIFPEKHIRKGQNFLIYRASGLYVKNLIRADIKRISEGETIQIESLEKDLRADFKAVPGLSVRFRGKADRIECGGAVPMIIDYKTGRGSVKDLTVAETEKLTTLTKALQLLIYAWLWQQEPHHGPVKAGIIFLRNHSAGVMPLNFLKSDIIGPEHLDAFEAFMKDQIEQLLDPKLVFAHNKKARNCVYCG